VPIVGLASLRVSSSLIVRDRSPPLGHVRQAQSLLFALAPQCGKGSNQLQVTNGRVFLPVGFKVARQFRLMYGGLAVGATGLDGGLLLLSQIRVAESPPLAPLRLHWHFRLIGHTSIS
jgi:hypothetical protein